MSVRFEVHAAIGLTLWQRLRALFRPTRCVVEVTCENEPGRVDAYARAHGFESATTAVYRERRGITDDGSPAPGAT